jgi:hypothetical protein
MQLQEDVAAVGGALRWVTLADGRLLQVPRCMS